MRPTRDLNLRGGGVPLGGDAIRIPYEDDWGLLCRVYSVRVKS